MHTHNYILCIHTIIYYAYTQLYTMHTHSYVLCIHTVIYYAYTQLYTMHTHNYILCIHTVIYYAYTQLYSMYIQGVRFIVSPSTRALWYRKPPSAQMSSSSSSSSGPGAYAPDAPQPIGLLSDPCPPVILDVSTSAARRLHVHTTREILAAKGGTVGKNVGQ
jgi:hypothetical protein